MPEIQIDSEYSLVEPVCEIDIGQEEILGMIHENVVHAPCKLRRSQRYGLNISCGRIDVNIPDSEESLMGSHRVGIAH